MPNGHSLGFSVATICHRRWSIWRPEVAAMDCILTARTKTEAVSESFPICSA